MNTSEEIKSTLTAIVASRKGGIPLDSINDEYFRETGEDIPYLAMGFNSLYDMIRTMNTIQTERNQLDQVVYTAKFNTRFAHIVDLVSRQKDSRTRLIKKSRVEMKKKNNRATTAKRTRRLRKVNNKKQFFDSEGEFTEDSYESNDNRRNPVVICSPPRNKNHVHGPLIHTQQLIGDDFFLQLAIRNLAQPIWREGECSPLHCGLCVSGQTIRACTTSLQKVQSLSNRLVILLGAEDVYKGRSFEDMKADYIHLLDVLHLKYAFSEKAITLCTLPPLGNVGMYTHPDKMITLHKFNNWLRQVTAKNGYPLVDFHRNMTNANQEVEWDLFQLDARMVSGTSQPYVLFNKRGRKLAVSLMSR